MPVRLSRLNEFGAIKETSERIIDIRTGLLGRRGKEAEDCAEALRQCMRGKLDAEQTAEIESDERKKADDRAAKLRKRPKWWQFVLGVGVAYFVGSHK